MQNYIFDLFGTLVENHGFSHLIKRLFPEVRYDVLREYTVKTDFASIDVCLESISQKFNFPLNEQRRKHIKTAFAEWKKESKLYPNVIELLSHLRQSGAKIGLISNNHIFTESIFFDLGLEKYFDVVIFSHKVGYAKPEDEIYEMCLQKMGVSAESVVMIGDQLEKDVLKPTELGMNGLLFDPKNKSNFTPSISHFSEFTE